MKLGIVCGRFQVPELHEGHKKLIDQAIEENDEVLIITCHSTIGDLERNPYSLMQRWNMILKAYPKAIQNYVYDEYSDIEWSEKLDALIQRIINSRLNESEVEVTLYHGRDSFKDYYSGTYTTKEIKSVPGVSGTQIRNKLKENK